MEYQRRVKDQRQVEAEGISKQSRMNEAKLSSKLQPSLIFSCRRLQVSWILACHAILDFPHLYPSGSATLSMSIACITLKTPMTTYEFVCLQEGRALHPIVRLVGPLWWYSF